jgi:hypothetical protein
MSWAPVRASRRVDDCFADEIGIDFPAIDPLVERVRAAFFGEPADVDSLATQVVLSGRAASRGTVVSLDVPLHGTCGLCGGRGETWTEPCEACRGTGGTLLRHRIRFSVPPGTADGACFRFRVNSPHAASVRVEVRVAVARS